MAVDTLGVYSKMGIFHAVLPIIQYVVLLTVSCRLVQLFLYLEMKHRNMD